MDEEVLKRFFKMLNENFDFSKIPADCTLYKKVDKEVNVGAGGIGEKYEYYYYDGKPDEPAAEQDVKTDEAEKTDDTSYSASNWIFDPKKFTMEAKFKEAHDGILKVITNHGPLAQSEWYYVMKAIMEAGVSVKAGFQVTEFIAQMIIWYPEFFSMKANESERDMIHRYMKSISHESQKWVVGPDSHEVAIADMLCQRSLFHYKYDWTKRVHDIASELKTALQDIK